MAFATIDELAARLHLDIADDDEGGAQQALDDSTGIIQAEARQTISLVADDVIAFHIAPRTRSFTLPEYPVLALALTVDERELVDGEDFRWSTAGVVGILTGWSGEVIATYTHGNEPIPAELRGVCLSIAARIFTNPTGARREAAGNWSWDTDALVSEQDAKIIAKHGGPAHAIIALSVVEEPDP